MSKIKYYSLERIKKEKAQYNVIFGKRSNGKTYAILSEILENYVRNKKQGAYIRRWQTDIKGLSSTIFDGHIANGFIEELTQGEWTNVYFYSRRWYLCRTDPETKQRIVDSNPFCFSFSLSDMEHDKSTSYPNITTIFFDEFLTRSIYLRDEFILFCNVVSTIKRLRTDVVIYMAGNTVNQYCPYFAEMGLKNVPKMKKNKIDVYTYGESNLKVAVERCDSISGNKASDDYFAFNNPKLKMITEGEWELDIYPHLNEKFKSCNVLLNFYIFFDNEKITGNIMKTSENVILYFYRKTTEIKDVDKSIIFGITDSNPRHFKKLNGNKSKIPSKISQFFINDRVFYDTNETGDIVYNYLNWCKIN